MKVSKKFLSDYVDIKDIPYQELADKMVFAGNEYESIGKLINASGLVIGKVIECVNHPNSDHLHICQVDIGEEIVQIVCGAPNVRKDIKVIVAKVGAKLPKIEIKEAIIAGEKSSGMICSIEELGLEHKYLKEEDKNGIHVLDNDAIVGLDPISYLGYDDEIIDFELTANRADLLNILGMAYEVAAIYDLEVKMPDIDLQTEKEDINDIYSLDVLTEKCPIYLGRLVKDVEIKESPNFIKERLIASGIRPINNVVDISNYVMLEIGNPLHFFDSKKLGNKVIVRNALDNEQLVTLDNVNRTLTKDDIVISNEQGPVALAGVMGGLDTEITEETKDIFIEAAIFDSLSIRYTSKKILKSEASSRYEKGIDPYRTKMALDRACYLLTKYASGKCLNGVLTYDKTDKTDKKITISLDKINSVLGMNLDENTFIDTLRRLNFVYHKVDNKYDVYVPTRRLDVNEECDLIEEVGRIVGYDNVLGKLPLVPIKMGSLPYRKKYINEIKEILVSSGLNEVFTYSLTSKDNAELFINEKYESVYLESPMSEDRCVMRHSLIPSLINVFEYNNSRNIKDISIFEVGTNYYKKDEYVEEKRVAGLMSGNIVLNSWKENIKVDFYVLKGVIENLLDYLGFSSRYAFVRNTDKELHSGISASIILDNESIGFLGKVHPNFSKKDIYVFEINIEKLLNKKIRNIKVKEINKYPSINKDLAFIVDKNIPALEIIKILKKVGGRLLENVSVFDVYTGENVLETEKSLAFSLEFQDMTKTLTDSEVNILFDKMIYEVENKLGAKLRNK